MSSTSVQEGSCLYKRWQTVALLVGLLGLAIAGFGLYQGVQHNDARPLYSWLIATAFWLSIGIGSLFLVMLFYVINAGWSTIIRRQLEHVLAIFPWLALLFIPLLLTIYSDGSSGLLWTWMNPDAVIPGGELVREDVLYAKKSAFLNVPFFTVRVILYFTVFCSLSWLLRKYSFKMDKHPDLRWYRRAFSCSAAGLALTALSATFAAYDLFMSLSYHWFSTMYGVWFFAASMRTGLAVAIIICAYAASKKGPLEGIYNQAHRYNLGCMALAFTVFWAYISFCQYFLIYHANIPEETFWYNIRELAQGADKNSWWYVGAYGLIFGHFFIPFFMLLSYRNKIIEKRALFIAAWILLFTILDFYFNILPGQIPAENALGYTVRPFSITLFDIAAWIGFGGISLWAFFRSQAQAEIIPIHDPRIQESLAYHE